MVKLLFCLITLSFFSVNLFADTAIFYDKNNEKVLSAVDIGERVIVGKEKCAKNNNIPEDDIEIYYLKDIISKEIIKNYLNLDKIKTKKLLKLDLKNQKERKKEKEKEEKEKKNKLKES